MLSSSSFKEIAKYTVVQCNSFFPDGAIIDFAFMDTIADKAGKRLEYCFSKIKSRYFSQNGMPYFNHLHGDQYSMWLYILSNTVFNETKDESIASKIFLLNKALFGIDVFYSVHLPEVFLFVHPLGSVLGNATYSNFFVAYQGVTVGSTTLGVYPCFGPRTILYSNASVIGDCKIGSDFVLGANSSIINTSIENNCLVTGNYPKHIVGDNKNQLIRNYFYL